MGTLFAAGEDSDGVSIGSAGISTLAGAFRSSYARCGLLVSNGAVGLTYWRFANVFSSASFWFTARIWNTGGNFSSPDVLWKGLDVSNIVRLRVRNTSGNTSGGTFVVEKLDSTGAATQLGSSFTSGFTDSTLYKWDLKVVNAVAGSIEFYVSPANGGSPSLRYSFSGDTTTNGVTVLTGYDAGQCNTLGNTQTTVWSEMITHTAPTLSMSLAGGHPVANGNTHNFTSAAAANVNPITMNLATPDYSNTAGQIDQYTVGAIPAGSFSVRAVVVGGTGQKGTSGPSKLDWGVRTGAADFWSPDIAMSALNAPAPSQYAWDLNPNTGVAWQTTEVGNAAGFNIGARSVI